MASAVRAVVLGIDVAAPGVSIALSFLLMSMLMLLLFLLTLMLVLLLLFLGTGLKQRRNLMLLNQNINALGLVTASLKLTCHTIIRKKRLGQSANPSAIGEINQYCRGLIEFIVSFISLRVYTKTVASRKVANFLSREPS